MRVIASVVHHASPFVGFVKAGWGCVGVIRCDDGSRIFYDHQALPELEHAPVGLLEGQLSRQLPRLHEDLRLPPNAIRTPKPGTVRLMADSVLIFALWSAVDDWCAVGGVAVIATQPAGHLDAAESALEGSSDGKSDVRHFFVKSFVSFEKW